jgi:serpin B
LDDPVDFALTLYRQTAALKPGANALVSPYSAREAFGLAYLGARGKTADGLARALRAGRLEDFLAHSRRARAELAAADPETAIETANSLWLRANWKFRDSYAAKARDGFGAELFRRDFGPQTVKDADAWVSRKTHGKITEIVEKLDRNDIAVLLNAVYFKGIWHWKFDKKLTEPKDFHLASGKTVQRPRMAMGDDDKREFDYAEDGQLQAVRLPYGSDRLAMIVLLPREGTMLESLGAKLDGTWWHGLRARMEPRPGDVELPRFKFDATVELKAPLEAMGAGLAFDANRADFQDMAATRKAGQNLSIGKAVQKATIEVDEDGTVAAATTALTMMITGAMEQPQRFRFVADRPFLFAIEDGVTGTLLFVGSVQDPGAGD